MEPTSPNESLHHLTDIVQPGLQTHNNPFLTSTLQSVSVHTDQESPTVFLLDPFIQIHAVNVQKVTREELTLLSAPMKLT